MALKQVNYRIKGMNLDLSRSVHSSENSFENKNVRLTAKDNGTYLSVEQEKGTKQFSLTGDTTSLTGIPLGHAVVNNGVVVFINNGIGDDYIYHIYNFNTLTGIATTKLLYHGNLGFNIDSPIETLFSYENEDIQKVYWIDKRNSPRFINIKADTSSYTNDSFNFLPKLNLQEVVTVTKENTGSGVFPAGTIQYAFTYYNKHGLETNIFYTTPLLYSSHTERGGAPDDTCTNTFNIRIENVDLNFEFLRIYSIIRTSKDSTPIIRKVIDLQTDQYALQTLHIWTLADELYYPRPILEYSWTDVSSVAETTNYYTNEFGAGINNAGFEPTVLHVDSNGTLTPLGIYHDVNSGLNYLSPVGTTSIQYFNEGDSLVSICTGTKTLTIKKYNSSNTLLETIDGTSKAYEWEITGTLTEPFPITIDATYPGGWPYYVVNILIPTDYNFKEITYISEWVNGGAIYTITNTNANTKFYKTNYSGEKIEIINPTVETIELGISSGFFDLIIEGNFSLNITSILGNVVYDYTNTIGKVIITLQDSDYTNITVVWNSDPGEWVLNTSEKSDTSIVVYNDNGLIPSLIYTDDNTTGEITSPTKLLYVGGEDIIAESISQKDNTLFLGNITLKKKLISTLDLNSSLVNLTFVSRELYTEYSNGTVYGYKPESLNLRQYFNGYPTTEFNNLKSFKYKETYRFGLLAQHNTGAWSDVIFLTDAVNNIPPNTFYNDLINHQSVSVNGSKAIATITDTSFIDTLVANGFTKVRGVIVHPELQDRTIIALGIVSPTVFNVDDRYNNYNYTSSSWFFRPTLNKSVSNYDTTITQADSHSYTEYRHNHCIPGWEQNNGEFQCNSSIPGKAYLDDYANISISTESSFQAEFPSNYYVDLQVLTFHSPEIEFDTLILGLDGEQFKMRIIGFSNLTGQQSNLDIVTSTPALDDLGGERLPNYIILNYSSNINPLTVSPAWYDRIKLAEHDDWTSIRKRLPYMVYPWHSSRSLNNDIPGASRSALLDNKKLANFRYSGYNTYLDSPWTPSTGISTLGIHLKENDQILKITSPSNINNKITYLSNIDKVLGVNHGVMVIKDNGSVVTRGGFPLTVSYDSLILTLDNSMGPNYTYTNSELPKDYKIGTELTRVLFKSNTHGVFSIKNAGTTLVILPTINSYNNVSTTDKIPFWDNNPINVSQSDIIVTGAREEGFWIVELYRDEVISRFGGNTLEAYKLNNWLVGGEAVNLIDQSTQLNKDSITIEYTEGDVFVLRYDCLKTYAESTSLVNGVTDIVSFLVETRINLDARYDRNRATINNTVTSPTNYNLLNPVYNQANNYFTYHTLDPDFASSYFPNTFTWTLKKLPAAIIDNWTLISMINTYDVVGTLGLIRSLNLFNDVLLGFQDRGLFQVNYNSRVLINTNDGTPIELANSGTVDSVRYFSTTIGSKNKQSIKVTSSGVYFIDDEAKTINVFNGQINSLSDNYGMATWMKKNYSFYEPLNMEEVSNFITHYDKESKDVYFINSDTALCYNELLQSFTSFYDYERSLVMFGLGNYFYSINDINAGNNPKLWGHKLGNYGQYYGRAKDMYIKYLVNPDPALDKTFTNFEMRADVFTSNGILQAGTSPFNSMTVTSEYLTGTSVLNASTLRLKFRIWRGFMPRGTDNSSLNSTYLPNPNRIIGIDRIRNPWIFVTLTKNATIEDISRTVLHDISFTYNI